MAKFLSQYEPQVEDFVGSHVELQSGGIAQVNPHPGYHIMVHLNTKSELLRLVSMCFIVCSYADCYAVHVSLKFGFSRIKLHIKVN
jgi:hypothetical protein